MKSNLFILFFSLFISCIYAQSSNHFLPEGIVKQWNVVTQEFFEPITTTTAYRTGRDTLIQKGDSLFRYVQIEITSDSTYTNWTARNTFIREDTLNSEVYIYNSREEQDDLLYDFNMQIGDPITYDEYCTLIVTAIDSIQLENGEKRKRLRLERDSDFSGYIYWIEGIGSTNGPISGWTTLCFTDTGGSLSCYYENEERIYSRNGGQCFVEVRPERTLLLDYNITQQWNVASMDFSTSVSTVAYRTDTIAFVSRGYPYKQVDYTLDVNYENWQPTSLYLIEESYSRRVYLFDQSTEEEILLYDFNLDVGDSMMYYDCTIKVVEIDTIEIFNGDQRKRWKVQTDDLLEDYWIEGIGSVSGLLYGHNTICSTDAVQNLTCYFENGEKIYDNGFECFIVNTKEFSKFQKISIYPNPVQNELVIDLSDISITGLRISVFSILGQKMKAERVWTGKIQRLDVENLPDGIYFLNFEKDERVIRSERFVKTR